MLLSACKVLDSCLLGVVSVNLRKHAWAFRVASVIHATSGGHKSPRQTEKRVEKKQEAAAAGHAGRGWPCGFGASPITVCSPILCLSRGRVEVELTGTSSPPWAFAQPPPLC